MYLEDKKLRTDCIDANRRVSKNVWIIIPVGQLGVWILDALYSIRWGYFLRSVVDGAQLISLVIDTDTSATGKFVKIFSL